MIAYLLRSPKEWLVILVDRPCNGPELLAGRRIVVSGKREAQAMCKACGYKPWNF
jgi:hypothetical protein